MKKISRKEAISAGLNRYFTGKRCKHGHIAERLICGLCVKCSKMHQDSYAKTEHYKKLKNKRSEKAKNITAAKAACGYRKWESEEIKKVIALNPDGSYRFTQMDLVNELQRSLRAIHHIRRRNKINQ